MAIEIERKFLLSNQRWRQQVVRTVTMCQGYLQQLPLQQGAYGASTSENNASIRVRVSDDKAYLNIKSATIGIVRQEYEYQIPVADANEILKNLCVGPLIEKNRHFVKYADHMWEIDEFSGDNAGLIVAEIELTNENEAFERPDWIGEEVSQDSRYYNVFLSSHPFKSWQD